MKKNITIVAVILLILGAGAFFVFRFVGGGSSHVAVNNNAEPEVTGKSKVLVAYFSWSGNVQQMARWVADSTGGDLFRIVPEDAYGDAFNECADRAQEELKNKERPALSSHIDKDVMEEYDIIYLGFPVWWYDLPMPVWTFLEEYNLEGKTIIPFLSHNGSSNGAGSLDTIAALTPGSNFLRNNLLSIAGSDVPDSKDNVTKWVEEQGK